jgi:NADPH2:quinone reductase
MRRVVVERYGPPEVMNLVEGPVPEPGEGEVLVQVSAAGVNFVDIYQRSGAYRLRFPATPGIEGSGVVSRVGAAVSGVAPGDRVAWSGVPGSYASHCVVPVHRLVPVPDQLDLGDAAAALIHGMTAHFLASDVVPLTEGSSCLVHAAAGGVGGLLCQVAAARGATVIGTVSSPAKAEVARAAGAAHVINYADGAFADRVRELTDGAGVDVVYDGVGAATFDGGLDCLRARGTFVLYGQSSGPVKLIDPQRLNANGSLYFTKASLSHYDRTRDQLLRRAGEVFGQVMAGRLRVRVHASYSLPDAAAAHRALEARATTGKVLLRP